MATSAVSLKTDGAQLLRALNEAREQLGNAGAEVVLDFSSVARIDAAGLKALEELVRLAEEKSVNIVLRGINVDVYKVLKLVKLSRRVTVVHQ